MNCEIKALGRAGSYETCSSKAVRISRFGYFSCELHSSVADLKLAEIDPEESVKRIETRDAYQVVSQEEIKTATHILFIGEDYVPFVRRKT